MQENLDYREFKSDSKAPKPTWYKRVMIVAAVGVVLLAVTVVVLLLTVGRASPDPVLDTIKLPHHNPYFVAAVLRQNGVMYVDLKNERKRLENDTKFYENSSRYIPIIRETHDNYEPKRLRVIVRDHDGHMSQLQYVDPDLPRWHVPYYHNRSVRAESHARNGSGFRLYNDVNGSFQWYYKSALTGNVSILDTRDCRLQYFDKYLEFETRVDSEYIYGMGERIHSFHLKQGNYSLWNRYNPQNSDSEQSGTHPFVLGRLTSVAHHNFFGLYMHNSNAMLFSVWKDRFGQSMINYKMVGGVIDLYIFHSGSPQQILRKYHSVIGKPYLPAAWAMGLQWARKGSNVRDFKNVIKEHTKNYIPIDALWADEEMNEVRKTFTVNNYSFRGLKELVDGMHDDEWGINMKFVAIANPALVKDSTYKYYLEAVKKDSLIKSALHYERPYEGFTSAGISVWLDFFAHNTSLIWAGGLIDMHNLTSYDGVWITGNEIENKCNGECSSFETSADDSYVPDPFHNASEFDHLQFRPTLEPLETQALPMAGYHEGNNLHHKQFFTHNLFSIQSAKATFDALSAIFESKRFLVASRSTWAGSGHFSSHWLAGNSGTWKSMVDSISGILNFNMFGIPHVGAPIGGFFLNCSRELLVRWFELGAYYPLMLSYSNYNTYNKDAFAFPEMIPFIKNAILERYALIRFMYTKMFEAHLQGGAVVHPLFFDFPNDEEAYRRDVVDKTFMWASSLYVVPSVFPGQTTSRVYLPNWTWYDLRTLEKITDYDPYARRGKYVDLDQPLGHINVFIKGGTIIPYHMFAKEAKIMNTKDLEYAPIRILVAPDFYGRAEGNMVVDFENVRINPDFNSNTYRYYSFTYMNKALNITKLAGLDISAERKYEYFQEVYITDGGELAVDIRYACMVDRRSRRKELQFLRGTGSRMIAIYDEGYNKTSLRDVELVYWGTEIVEDPCGVRSANSEYSTDQ
eukprot:TRINITY_DN1360_c0_g1_i5.p1 TRINITY_DN1360_c0_g1~~TRINITY_DN1360_c0_g1_i5.p1  ORF type:complete len:968 (-),score=269.75 TRINITY_DN1360_c0_g1_i5:112-3015(-)